VAFFAAFLGLLSVKAQLSLIDVRFGIKT